MKFSLLHQDPQSKARVGTITTDHGTIQTPIFMPVGTLGTVKAVHQRELYHDLKAQIILANTYHLYMRPSKQTLEKAGGLHKFMNWQGPILTDSGGYQVYSLGQRRKITEEGVTFRSHIDGSQHLFTPEKAIDIQRSIGADIIMTFDECTPSPCTYTYAKASMELTHRWLQRCCKHFDTTKNLYNHSQTLFPIVQGSIYKDLRTHSAEVIATTNRQGYAIGGVCHPTGQLYEVTQWVCDILPTNKPRYLMGVGTPKDLLECIALGVDMFDCVMPTRNARNGCLFTTQGVINIKNKQWAEDFTPIDSTLGTYASTQHSKAYLHHLIRAKELLGAQIATLHNLGFYLWLVKEARKRIIEGNFVAWKNTILKTITKKL